ncbi:InlB B-repeat-containing protein [Paenibacillus sp. ClWae2A]|uniref:InlB B-repeat-containing protein n=1 Tax=Paenibacillus sp. ClWae2A TaxID=3057177 RepID=UPI0028F5BE0B|nr:InlB B-repeat-containing protein [Paenibacillus sp. ClWae2A]MDT9721941.1 InlB B-repeat-containing protein [Paenibacillus sp. ClWae2A]
MNYKELAKVPSTPTREGYAFKGWYTDTILTNAYNFGSQVLGPITLYAKWAPTFTVSFDSKGGSAVNTQSLEYNAKAKAPTSPTRTGYVFNGCYVDEALTEAYNFDNPVTTALMLYAKWKALYTVKFDAGLSNTTPPLPKIVVEGDVAHAPDTSELPSNPGNTIYSWIVPYDFEQLAINGNLTRTIYARWTEL